MRRIGMVRVGVVALATTALAGAGAGIASAAGVAGEPAARSVTEGFNCGIGVVQNGQLTTITTTDSRLTIRPNGNRRLECRADIADPQPFVAMGILCGTGDGTSTTRSTTRVRPNGRVTLICRYRVPADADEPEDDGAGV